MPDFSITRINKGLGFHKEPLSSKPLSSQKESIDLPDFLQQNTWDFDDAGTYKKILSDLENPWLGEAKQPLSPSAVVCAPSAAVAPPPMAVSPSLKIKAKNQPVDFVEEGPALEWTPNAQAVWSFKSVLWDAVLAGVVFFPMFFLFLFLTELNPLLVLKGIWPHIAVVFALFLQVYCLLCRLFCAATYGEEASKRRLCRLSKASAKGLAEENHPMRLFWRSLIVCLTGGVVLPVLGRLLKKDFLGALTGLYFCRRALSK